MLFYEIEFKTMKDLEKKNKNEQSVSDKKICSQTTSLNGKIAKNICFYVSQVTKDQLVLACVEKEGNKEDYLDKARKFVKHLDVEAEYVNSTEITIERFVVLVETAYRSNFVDDDDQICASLGLEDMHMYEGDSRLKEEIIDMIDSKEAALAMAKKLLFVPDLLPEIERIFVECNQKKFFAHPVQYVVMADNDKVKKDVRKILVGSLYKANRLASKRICYVGRNTDRCDQECIDIDVTQNLYKAQHGSTIIFQPEPYVSISGDSNKNHEIMQQVCQQILQYHSDTLNIIELKRGDEKTLKQVYNELPDVKFVVLKESQILISDAKRYLRAKARVDKIKDTKSLLEMLPDKKMRYYPIDLDKIYSKWFDDRLCTEIYPQYRTVSVAAKVVENKPKGNAYRQLESLIGLKVAKQIIKSAVDYQNAQKLFDDNGMYSQKIARHMVFTGNPGSAKTTVARLFAQIMKDNEILSEGDLIECGRADIVDRYLGGTAPRIQRLFKKATGSVLFIDEAYSLVDGEIGGYGDEAINTIVQEMENHRDDTIVIFAGYPDKMEKFLDSNPGLRSRIAFHVPFEDYNSDELSRILNLFVKDGMMVLSGDVQKKVMPIFEEAVKHPDFGNGRFVRNLYERARMRQASRLVTLKASEINREVLSTLKAEDFEMPAKYVAKNTHRTIGFAG